MSLKSAIDKELNSKTETKRDKILKIKEDIIYMLDNDLSIKKQIDLLVGEKIVDKISQSEYIKILKKDFGYSTREKKIETVTTAGIREETKREKKTVTKVNPNRSATDILSQGVDLLS